MRIVVCGEAAGFSTLLMEKLVRESHAVYHITDKTTEVHSFKRSGVVTYNIAMTDESTRFLISNIAPEAVIFLGAHDAHYNWEKKDNRQTRYLSSLTNLLMICSELDVEKVIYLSDYEVFGSAEDELDELDPDSMRGIVIAEGERICLGFNKLYNSHNIILRIANIYGPLENTRTEKPGEIAEYCREALLTGHIHIDSRIEKQYTYIDDAVDAVYRVLQAKKFRGRVYNVSGGDPISGADIAKHIKILSKQPEIIIEDVERDYLIDIKRLCVSNETFSREFYFRERTDIFQGTANTLEWVTKNLQGLQRKQRARENSFDASRLGDMAKFIFKKMLPFIENGAVFIVAALLTLATRDTPYFGGIDFMLIYIILISITFGKQQAALAVLATMVMFAADKSLTGFRIIDIFADVNFLVRLLVLFTVGIIIGHTKDRLRQIIAEKNEQIEYHKTEIAELNAIYETTLKIKNVLEDRLLNYGDSLAKIYSIVVELDGLIPQKILLKAINVIMTIMGSEDVAIYYCNPGSPFCRVAVASSNLSNSISKSIRYKDMLELSYAMSKREVYVNRTFDPELPLMASPVYRGDELIAIIMIWKIAFEKMTPYQINLFVVLTKLIASSIERAFAYDEASRATKLIENTIIYTRNSLLEYMDIAKESKRKYDTPYTVVEILTNGRTQEEISEILVSQLRSNDYMGIDRYDRLVVLLSNTSHDEADFFTNRIKGFGVETRVVEEA